MLIQWVDLYDSGRGERFVVDAGATRAFIAFHGEKVEVWHAKSVPRVYRLRGRYSDIEEACAAASDDEELRAALESVAAFRFQLPFHAEEGWRRAKVPGVPYRLRRAEARIKHAATLAGELQKLVESIPVVACCCGGGACRAGVERSEALAVVAKLRMELA